MSQELNQPGLGGASRHWARRVRRGVAIATIVAAASVAGSSSPAPAAGDAASGSDDARQIADRTLVPKRIRLIIGWTRPRLV